MIKFLSLEFLGLSHRIPGKIKNAVYCLEISALVFMRYLSLKNVQNMQMRGLMTSITQPNITSSI